MHFIITHENSNHVFFNCYSSISKVNLDKWKVHSEQDNKIVILSHLSEEKNRRKRKGRDWLKRKEKVWSNSHLNSTER